MPAAGAGVRRGGRYVRRAERTGLGGLLWRALYSGVLGGLALGLLVLLLAPRAGAAGVESGLRLYGADREDFVQAPQLQTDVFIQVTGMLARVRVEQRFRNPGAAWVEGIYVFPLAEDAAVDRLRLRYAGRLIEGEVQERQQARRTYDKARAAGTGAGLLDQQRANVFTTSVANIPPAAEVEVSIEYQQQVRWLDGEFSLRFPTVVGPRYIPGVPLPGEATVPAGHGWAVDTDQVPDASRITPPVAAGADDRLNPLRITAELAIGLPLADLVSPYHPIDVVQTGHGRYRAVLAHGSAVADRDFVLRWRPAPAQQPTAALFAETWRGRHYALLTVMPPEPAAVPRDIGRELILVVDTSGSMHGDSIEQARAALLDALGRLRPGDRFNIIAFNQSTAALYRHAVPADPVHLQQARRYVAGLEAEGGTEMLPAMRLALRDTRPSGLLRQVVFVTDGAVGNEAALFRAVAEDIGDSRLFAVGIGSAPNALFMNRAAGLGRGTFTYIGSSNEVETKVGALFRQLASPVLTDVRLHWQTADGQAAPQQTPQTLPDLYAGEPLVVAVQSGAAPQAVEIEGWLGERRWRHSVDLQGGASAAGVHALWARRRIDDWLGRLVVGEDPDTVRDAVLALALEHQLVSRYTSLVAVDRTPSRPPGSALDSAPLATRLPAGWSADAVFGRLPGTATPAALYLWLGLSAIALAVLVARRRA